MGVDQQLPHQDRRLRGRVVHPLLRDLTKSDRRGRRDPVLVRRHQSGLRTVLARTSGSYGNRLKQRSASPSTPTRNASMRENPAGTVSPLTSPATSPLVSRPDTASSMSPAVSRHRVAVGRGDALGQLGGRHPGQAGGPQPGLGGVEHQSAVLVLQRHHVARHQRRVGGVVALQGRAVEALDRWTRRSPAVPAGRRRWCWLAGQYDTGGLGRASGHVEAAAASKLSCGGFFGANRMFIASMSEPTEASVTGNSPVWSDGQFHRQIAAALLDLLEVDRRARRGPVGEAELERRDPLERRAVLVADAVAVVLAEQRVAERDHRRQKVVQPLTGVEGEPRRLALGHPAQVHPGQAVGLLLGHQGRHAPGD